MNKTLAEAVALTMAIKEKLSNFEFGEDKRAILCPPYPFLVMVKDLLGSNHPIRVGAQNCHQYTKGAYTGEVSAPMLRSAGASYVILGHSERRAYFGETNELIKKKVDAALDANLSVIFCCGEQLGQREAEQHFDIVEQQVKTALFHLSPEELQRVTIAYEPVWAIGTGRTASAAQAEEMHAHIRSLLAGKFDEALANDTTILYGGSCKPSNALELFSQPNVDGGLIGGASLKADAFVEIIKSL